MWHFVEVCAFWLKLSYFYNEADLSQLFSQHANGLNSRCLGNKKETKKHSVRYILQV